ncbi:TMV resistance protein N-like [Rutidosis leptorrhynchoides]|uniref:TMV resistance protein N-like n=1 Tax=Rutidosis leptorrhynchoides TaxID=125765 RepID=UPI003A99759B
MKKLRLLIVKGVRFHDEDVEGDRFHDEDVEGPCFLSNELQYISYNNYPGSPFPADFQPMKLVVLTLRNTLQKELWQDYKRLPQLKKLTIEYSKKLVSTPNFDGFPSLEYLKLHHCDSLEAIHPSLGNCNSLVNLFVNKCKKLRTFPTIVCMKNLEILEIIKCQALVKFPEIQASMDSLKKLIMKNVGIEVLPASSIGYYCTNLIFLKLTDCEKLRRIEGNFHASKHLEKLKIKNKHKLEKLPNDLFSVCVCNLKRLDLSDCKLEDGEIPCSVGELFNLIKLDLSGNNFSRLHFSLLKLTRLKALNLSDCNKLLTFPELPSNVDLFLGYNSDSLESMGDFYKNCKSLSLVFLAESNDVSGAEGLLQCMLHGKAINHHMVLCVDGLEIPKTFKPPLLEGSRCRLQLPKNWYNDFSGFLMCAVLTEDDAPDINLKHEQSNTMGMNFEAELWNECNDDDYVTSVSYVSFDSLRHTTWWDSNSNAVSFSFEGCQNIWCSGFGVKLVARENESVTTETATDSSEFWEDEDDYTFKFNFVDDTKSSLKLRC